MARRRTAAVRSKLAQRIKLIFAVALLPVCAGTGQAVLDIVRAASDAATVGIALASGFACWLVIYLSLPKPMWAYVFGHELTHVLWTWLFWGKVKGFKATPSGGHVIVTRSNFLVALAPYFFPIYMFAIALIFLLGDWLWDWRPYLVCFHLLLGFSYGFHATLTWRILRTRQSDIVEQGYVFSAVIIWLGNALVLLVAIPLLTAQISILTALNWSWCNTVQVITTFVNFLVPAWHR